MKILNEWFWKIFRMKSTLSSVSTFLSSENRQNLFEAFFYLDKDNLSTEIIDLWPSHSKNRFSKFKIFLRENFVWKFQKGSEWLTMKVHDKWSDLNNFHTNCSYERLFIDTSKKRRMIFFLRHLNWSELRINDGNVQFLFELFRIYCF